ncbi:hypothetical protein BDN67DRAFT_466064 [Paxillus ammoniavirescens]|nr:hypothetical protein BDN67DRAFT_466064 [Paxillus ammoniavirescens]
MRNSCTTVDSGGNLKKSSLQPWLWPTSLHFTATCVQKINLIKASSDFSWQQHCSKSGIFSNLSGLIQSASSFHIAFQPRYKGCKVLGLRE